MGASPLMSVGMPAAALLRQLRMRWRASRVFCNLGKGEFALLPVGPSARVAASCTASDSNQNSYAQRSLQKRSLLRRLGRLKDVRHNSIERPTPRTKLLFLQSRKGGTGTFRWRLDEIPT